MRFHRSAVSSNFETLWSRAVLSSEIQRKYLPLPRPPSERTGDGGNVRSRNPPPRRRGAPEGCAWAPDVGCASSCGSGSDPAGGGGAGNRAGRGRARFAAALAPPPAAPCPRVPPEPRTSLGPRRSGYWLRVPAPPLPPATRQTVLCLTAGACHVEGLCPSRGARGPGPSQAVVPEGCWS